MDALAVVAVLFALAVTVGGYYVAKTSKGKSIAGQGILEFPIK